MFSQLLRLSARLLRNFFTMLKVWDDSAYQGHKKAILKTACKASDVTNKRGARHESLRDVDRSKNRRQPQSGTGSNAPYWSSNGYLAFTTYTIVVWRKTGRGSKSYARSPITTSSGALLCGDVWRDARNVRENQSQWYFLIMMPATRRIWSSQSKSLRIHPILNEIKIYLHLLKGSQT